MKIAISGDCLNVFTSAYPVRGMLLNLIKLRPQDSFVIFYTLRPISPKLVSYYDELHSLKNVEVKYFKNSRIIIGLKRFFLNSTYFNLGSEFDMFWNPSYLEYINGFKGIQLSNITDLSILRGHASIPHSKIWKFQNKIAKRFYFSRKNLNIVSISKYTYDDIYEYFNVVRAPITIIHNGIDDFWHNNDYIDIKDLKAQINGSYFIWWGFISRRKNILSLIKAYILAKKQNCRLPKLLLVGDVAEHMKTVLANIHSPDIIHIPFQSNLVIKTLVKNSCGLIFPSYYEGFGLPIIEAFSQGIPVACSNVTSLPEIADGKAILFNPYNVDEICNAINKLSKMPKNDNILKQYASKFTYKRMAEQYNCLINNLFSNNL